MAYTVQLRLLNDTSDVLYLCEQSCGEGTSWTTVPSNAPAPFGGSMYTLNLVSSGSCGMLRFKTLNGHVFAVAVGVHNYKRWCDLQVDLNDRQVCTVLQQGYYKEGDPKSGVIWQQADQVSATTKEGRKISVKFYQNEGNRLLGVLTYV
ncbi:hypothetical protein N0V88_007285 [Collariella sp. IMI 366227]|nr:hypothetical protein N0V88_007285 [Collariella sp. IMI 366227]